MNKYTTKWAIIAPVAKSFNKHYKAALKAAGFSEIGCYGVFAFHFNENNPASVDALKAKIAKLKSKIGSYKNKKGIFSFIITDSQFGFIGSEKANKLMSKKGWLGLPLDNEGNKNIPVTYNQMYAHGAIVLPYSQASYEYGVTFQGDNFKRVY